MTAIDLLIDDMFQNSHQEHKVQMEEYMRNLFPFVGIKAPLRKKTLSSWVQQNKAEVMHDLRSVIEELYALEEREFHYCAIDLSQKYLKKIFVKDDLELIQLLIERNSWWDSVDAIAKHVLGPYLIQFSSLEEQTIDTFSDSSNMWYNRCAIIYQLGFKEHTNYQRLFHECKKHASSQEFFIQKAIGWALREYAKHEPERVFQFVKNNQLAPLSEKEALKHFKS